MNSPCAQDVTGRLSTPTEVKTEPSPMELRSMHAFYQACRRHDKEYAYRPPPLHKAHPIRGFSYLAQVTLGRALAPKRTPSGERDSAGVSQGTTRPLMFLHMDENSLPCSFRLYRSEWSLADRWSMNAKNARIHPPEFWKSNPPIRRARHTIPFAAICDRKDICSAAQQIRKPHGAVVYTSDVFVQVYAGC